jgi:hypothetical protein
MAFHQPFTIVQYPDRFHATRICWIFLTRSGKRIKPILFKVMNRRVRERESVGTGLLFPLVHLTHVMLARFFSLEPDHQPIL